MKFRDDADAVLDSRRAELAADARRSVARLGRDLLGAAPACARTAPKRAIATAGILGLGLGVASPRLFRSFRAAVGGSLFLRLGVHVFRRIGIPFNAEKRDLSGP